MHLEFKDLRIDLDIVFWNPLSHISVGQNFHLNFFEDEEFCPSIYFEVKLFFVHIGFFIGKEW